VPVRNKGICIKKLSYVGSTLNEQSEVFVLGTLNEPLGTEGILDGVQLWVEITHAKIRQLHSPHQTTGKHRQSFIVSNRRSKLEPISALDPHERLPGRLHAS
jgi:hypothetical protein